MTKKVKDKRFKLDFTMVNKQNLLENNVLKSVQSNNQVLYYIFKDEEPVYVGVTNNFLRRKQQHFSEKYRKSYPEKVLYKAMKKYGSDAFSMYIIHEGEYRCDILELEEEHISGLQYVYKAKYNIADGGLDSEFNKSIFYYKDLQVDREKGASSLLKLARSARDLAYNSYDSGTPLRDIRVKERNKDKLFNVLKYNLKYGRDFLPMELEDNINHIENPDYDFGTDILTAFNTYINQCFNGFVEAELDAMFADALLSAVSHLNNDPSSIDIYIFSFVILGEEISEIAEVLNVDSDYVAERLEVILGIDIYEIIYETGLTDPHYHDDYYEGCEYY